MMNEVIQPTLVVYTALFGPYDKLVDPSEKYSNCEFYCFTDQTNLKSNIWRVIYIDLSNTPPDVANRKCKILAHQYLSKYAFSLYVDTNVVILKNPYCLIEQYLKDVDIAMPKHFSRSSIYDEAFVLLRSGRVERVQAINQMFRYIRVGYRCQTEMGENNILLRRHHQVESVMNAWWHEYCSGAKRDQLSLAYVLWQHKTNFRFLSESARAGTMFELRRHIRKKNRNFLWKILDYAVFAVPYYVALKIYIFIK